MSLQMQSPGSHFLSPLSSSEIGLHHWRYPNTRCSTSCVCITTPDVAAPYYRADRLVFVQIRDFEIPYFTTPYAQSSTHEPRYTLQFPVPYAEMVSPVAFAAIAIAMMPLPPGVLVSKASALV